jgi:hypothetical protein
MADIARHHHYIPQGYLRGFAQKRSGRQWYVHVTDLAQKRSYPTNTRNVCGERDFMRIDVAGHAPDRVEKDLSAFETKSVEAIRRVAASGKFEGEDATLTLNLMALLAVRSPEMRENMRDLHEKIANRVMDLSLATRERWKQQMEQLRDAGKAVNEDLTYEDMKAFHDGGQYKVTVKREFHMGAEFQMMPTVLEELGKRLWTVYTTDGKRGEFVTTDRPVTLTYVDPSKVPAWMRHSPGFALSDTEVHFPLTRHAVLVGRWDRGGHVEEAHDSFIGAVNAHMARNSFGQVFSREKRIIYIDPLLHLRWDEVLLKRFMMEPSPEELAEFRARCEDYESRNPSSA